jgi:hypothetical protein
LKLYEASCPYYSKISVKINHNAPEIADKNHLGKLSRMHNNWDTFGKRQQVCYDIRKMREERYDKAQDHLF